MKYIVYEIQSRYLHIQTGKKKKTKQTKPENFWSTKVCLPDNHDRKQVISQNEYQMLYILLITCF